MVFICVILVLYGFYGLTVRESIVFTFWGSAFQLFCCFCWNVDYNYGRNSVFIRWFYDERKDNCMPVICHSYVDVNY
uniref:Uncharacterized protein n=1 Tax=Klebsiella pneumoniae TaxID=573 RepID=A0A2P1BNT6_KLEPN|nr:hypothetical protein [Klebsiella pneumoniae]